MSCKCSGARKGTQESIREFRRGQWRVTLRLKARDVCYNNTEYAPKPSTRSTVLCTRCGEVWRTGAKYVDELPDVRKPGDSRRNRRQSATANKLKPNTIVQYKGGGYDGCFWEWNYAYIDGEGNFHNVVATGYRGCKTEHELNETLASARGDEHDLYVLDEAGEIERFGRETPISHLLTVGKWLRESFPNVKLTCICEICGATVEVASCGGEGARGIGGIAMEFSLLVCNECETAGNCVYCGEFVGASFIDDRTGYCTGKAFGEEWCAEKHGGKVEVEV